MRIRTWIAWGVGTCIWMGVIWCVFWWGTHLALTAEKVKKPLNPKIFAEWRIEKILSLQEILVLVVENPDAASTVRKAAMTVRPASMRLVGYRYFEAGTPRMFVYDDTEEKFGEVKLTTEQKKQCLGCHRDGEYSKEMSAGDAG